jgi:hypothetical protein
MTPALAIVGSGYWLDGGSRADAFAAALKLRAALTIPHMAVPFVKAGVGLYRATFDPAAGRIPEFYRRRMAAGPMASGAMRTFTDPSFVGGGGVTVFVTPHIAIEPEVETMIVHRESHNYFMTAVAVHMAYHFESHPGGPR